MPQLISSRQIKIEWTDILGRTRHVRPKTADKRSSGVHLSGVNKFVLTKLGYLNPSDLDDEMPLRMAIGMAWEDWAVGLWPDMVWQPGEWERDKVFGTPDGYTDLPFSSSSPTAGRVEEFKATWKSKFTYGTPENLLGEKGRLWMWQLLGNCYAMNCTFANLHILWINGPYRPPSPEYWVYEFAFSEKEKKQYWQNIVLPNIQNAVREEH